MGRNQVVRLFALNRVTPQAFASAMTTFKSQDTASARGSTVTRRQSGTATASGTADAEEGSKEHVLSGSNAYSVPVGTSMFTLKLV